MAPRQTDADLVHRFADSVWGVGLRTIVTPALMAIALFFGSLWLKDLGDTIKSIAARQERFEDALQAAVIRITAIEASSARGRAARDQDFGELLQELHDQRAAIVVLTSKVAALDATIQTMRDRASLLPLAQSPSLASQP